MDQVVVFGDKGRVSREASKPTQDEAEYQRRLRELKDKYGES
jgi:hypothetical protein